MDKHGAIATVKHNHLTRSLRLSHAFFAIVCCGMYLWIHNTIQPQFVIQVETNPSVLDLARIVREQQKKIEYMVAHPKIIFRCPDDEPKIKYPRQASDDLTRISIGTADECSNTTDLDALIIVHTSADHFKRRDRFRRTYANYNNTKPFRLKVVFLVGQVERAELGIKLEKENIEHGDTVLGSFLDTYQNLTLKAVMGYRWVSSTCSDIKLLIKMDDDVFFDVRKFFARYWNRIGGSLKTKAIHCQVWEHAKVGRTGKWKVERGLFSNSSYPFPYCAGYFVVVTPDLVRPMYEVGKSIEFFWIDDVFLYGMVPATIKNVHFAQVGKRKKLATESYPEWKNCMKRKGQAGCTYWAVLTNGEDEFDSEYDSFFAPRPAAEVAGNKTLVISSDSKNETGSDIQKKFNGGI